MMMTMSGLKNLMGPWRRLGLTGTHTEDVSNSTPTSEVKMTDCAICFSEVTAATGRSQMSCGHEFHMRCIVQWLQKPDGSGNCPCCRAEPTELERLVAAPTDSDSDSEYSDDESVAADVSTFTPLMRAVGDGDAALVERLLSTGGVGIDGEGGRAEPLPLSALLEERDSDGDTALVHAIVNESMEMVSALLAAGANINNRDNDGNTPLIAAIRTCEDDEIPLELIRRGADLTVVTQAEGYSALQYAAAHDMVNVLQVILECGVGRMGHALRTACANGSRDCALALLEAGADPNCGDDDGDDEDVRGMTPLMLCIANEPDHEIVTALIRHGANVNATDNSGWNVFMWMTRSADAPDPDIMAALLDAMTHWERGPDGRWREITQTWGDGDVVPPPYTLAEKTRAAARCIQALWRGWATRRRLSAPVAERQPWARLQITIPGSPVPTKSLGGYWERRMLSVV
jgi:ankyrin repeat protein